MVEAIKITVFIRPEAGCSWEGCTGGSINKEGGGIEGSMGRVVESWTSRTTVEGAVRSGLVGRVFFCGDKWKRVVDAVLMF